jgi:[acyl-carrier-protein] S-malonyltransferase
MIAFIFPGQGSQSVGMGKALAETYPEARATFAEADAAFDRVAAAALNRPLTEIIWDGPDDQLRLTEIQQPAILAVSVAAYRVLDAQGLRPSIVAGHSLGEYSANVAAGTLGFADALRVVQRRGRYMQEAVPVGTGAMAAILGADLETVRALVRKEPKVRSSARQTSTAAVRL